MVFDYIYSPFISGVSMYSVTEFSLIVIYYMYISYVLSK